MKGLLSATDEKWWCKRNCLKAVNFISAVVAIYNYASTSIWCEPTAVGPCYDHLTTYDEQMTSSLFPAVVAWKTSRSRLV